MAPFFTAYGIGQPDEAKLLYYQLFDKLFFFDARKKARGSIEFQYALAVAYQIVVPGEQVFGEGVEIERIILTALLASILELHREAGFTRAVIGIEQNVFIFWQVRIFSILLFEFAAQIGSERTQIF